MTYSLCATFYNSEYESRDQLFFPRAPRRRGGARWSEGLIESLDMRELLLLWVHYVASLWVRRDSNLRCSATSLHPPRVVLGPFSLAIASSGFVLKLDTFVLGLCLLDLPGPFKLVVSFNYVAASHLRRLCLPRGYIPALHVKRL
ncbi:hypothetical protein CRG98_019292 [Punica granatum]|uniref:Uncharacterized protein n=1 Tax=Punica granatum TaxID=22663 RepID=A0A2I0JY27_PUNGR|nr:hypothetical protein CRG98_019292 [Punica granatum]